MSKIKSIKAREILDSRGNPTIETKTELDDGSIGIASVPSGSSFGNIEDFELRDLDPNCFFGLGVTKAVSNINQIIGPKLIGKDPEDQFGIDKFMIELDGSPNKTNLGVNSIFSVSVAVCKSSAASLRIKTYEYIQKLSNKLGITNISLKIPIPIFNLINGGRHGAGNLEFQEFLIIPSSSKTYSLGLKMAEEIYHSVKQILIRHGAIHSVGDEGGFAPNLFTNLDALEVLVEAINFSGYNFGKDVFLGLDVAANFFYKDGLYSIRDRSSPMDTSTFIEFLSDLQKLYPLIILEDPLFKEDFDSWVKITQGFKDKTTIIGDDFLSTNYQKTEKSIKQKACNGILVKPNQSGTIYETLQVIKLCKEANWKIIVSHRSGETNDTFIAEFAVGVGADYTKFGAPARGERVAKYNRLLEIENEISQSSN